MWENCHNFLRLTSLCISLSLYIFLLFYLIQNISVISVHSLEYISYIRSKNEVEYLNIFLKIPQNSSSIAELLFPLPPLNTQKIKVWLKPPLLMINYQCIYFMMLWWVRDCHGSYLNQEIISFSKIESKAVSGVRSQSTRVPYKNVKNFVNYYT